jgi:hypothetical protein
MRVVCRFLASSGEEGKNGGRIARTTGHDTFHSLFTPAFERVVSEIGCRRLVLRVLEPADPTGIRLAFACGACEEVTHATVVILDGDVGLEKRVNRRAPGFL